MRHPYGLPMDRFLHFFGHARWRQVLACYGLVFLFAAPLWAQQAMPFEREAVIEELTPEGARALFGVTGEVRVTREAGDVPGWRVTGADGTLLGHVGSTWEIANSVGYSGRPIEMLVAISPEGRIVAAELVHHTEPILTLGLSDADIARFVGGFAGVDLTAPRESAAAAEANAPDIISRATVSTGVIRDGILRTGRALAIARGVIDAGRIDRVSFAPADWQTLLGAGAITHVRTTRDEAAAALAGAKTPVTPGEGPFLDLWAATGQSIL